jgi:hypothetical protein
MKRLLVAALLGLALRPASATALTFGADLAGPVDFTGTCGQLFSDSCTTFSGSTTLSYYAPASGTVTAVRVKTGNVAQGPMQIVVMSSLYQNHAGDPGHPYFACCFVAAYGPVFTPAPNSVTTIPTTLPMVEEPTPRPTIS